MPHFKTVLTETINMNIINRFFLFAVIIIGFQTNVYSTVLGPIEIEILGYDNEAQKLFFTRTDWADCDCETDLYIYHISNDSLEVISNWARRFDFRMTKNKVIVEKKLNYLTPLSITPLTDTIYSFTWLPKIPYFSRVINAKTNDCPFQIQIGDRKYSYKQCFNQKDKPLIKGFTINDFCGVLLIKYQGDCIEGNTRDILIFYKRDKDKIVSRELKIKDRIVD
jgi:hypothetical protein